MADVQHNDPEIQQTPFQSYFPYAQTAGGFGEFAKYETLVLWTTVEPQSLVTALKKTIATLDPDLPLSNAGSYDDLLLRVSRRKALTDRFEFILRRRAALAAIGLYAVLSYSVSLRVREIGVRMALGAQATNILKLVTYQGLRMICMGLIIGVGAGLILGHIIGGVLYGVSASDPAALLTGARCSLWLRSSLVATRLPSDPHRSHHGATRQELGARIYRSRRYDDIANGTESNLHKSANQTSFAGATQNSEKECPS